MSLLLPADAIDASDADRPRTDGSVLARARRGRSLADGMVLLGLLAVALWRWSLVTAVPGPIGVDAGNWLRLAQAMLGRVDVHDVVVPPLVPILVGLLDVLVGPLGAARTMTVLASIAPAAGTWWVLRRYRSDALTVIAALSVALVQPTAAAFAWGGVPQLLGLGLLPVALWSLAVATTTTDRRSWLRAGTIAAIVGLTSTLVSALLAVGGLTLLVVALLRRGPGITAGLSAGLAPLAPVGVLYVVILRRMSLPDGRTTAATGLPSLEHGLGAPTSLWVLLLALLAVSALAAVSAPTIDDRALLLVGSLAVAIGGVLLGDVRFVAGVPTAVAIATVVAPVGIASTRAVRTVAAGVLLALILTGVMTQDRQLSFYAQFTPRTILEDVTRIAAIIPPGARVAVPPVAGAPTGWWLEARGLNAAVASRSDWLSFPGERAAAADVLALFSAVGWPDRHAAGVACAVGAPWLYVPDAWGGMDPDALDREVAAGRMATVEQLPGGLLLRSRLC
jgi:hypothetical protein